MTEKEQPPFLVRAADQPNDVALVLYGAASATYLLGRPAEDEAICRGLVGIPPHSAFVVMLFGAHYAGHARVRRTGRRLRVLSVDVLAVCPTPWGRPDYAAALLDVEQTVTRPPQGMFLTADLGVYPSPRARLSARVLRAAGWHARGVGGRYHKFLPGSVCG